ncbi:MAG: hypothetical protein ABFE13_11525 [Phycisphaerales bacterium]
MDHSPHYVVRPAPDPPGAHETSIARKRRGSALDGTTFYDFFVAAFPGSHIDPEGPRDNYVSFGEAAREFRKFRRSQITLSQYLEERG